MKMRFSLRPVQYLQRGWLYLTALVSLGIMPLPALGANPDCGTPGLPNNLCTGGDVQGLINFIANWLTGIIGLVVVLIIIISGVQMISSAGNAEAVKSARGRMTNAIIGLLLLIFFRVIVNLIIPKTNL